MRPKASPPARRCDTAKWRCKQAGPHPNPPPQAQGCPGKIFPSRNKCLRRRRLWKFLALSTRDCELESFESLESFPGTAVPQAGEGARRRLSTFPIQISNSKFRRSRHCERSEAILYAVIPGWSAGPDLRCAIAHRGISRFRVRCFASPRNDGVWAAALAMTANRKSRHTFAPSRREAPEALMKLPPKEGVGNAGCPLHPRPRVHFALVKSTRVNEYTGITRRSRTQWF
jgi:hypothetical protein